MTDALCVICGKRPALDGWVDSYCTANRRRDLDDVVELTPDARHVARGQARRGTSGASGKPGSSVPFNVDATDTLNAVQNALTTLARDIADRRGLRAPRPEHLGHDTIVVAAAWLREQLEWCRHAMDGAEPYAVGAFEEIHQCARAVRRITYGSPERRYLGPCGAPTARWTDENGRVRDDCPGDIYARHGAAEGVCNRDSCRATVAAEERSEWLDGLVRTYAYTAAEIAHAYPEINAGTIRQWAHRGRLAATGADEQGRPRYTLGAVLDLAAAEAARREEQRARRARKTTAA